MELKFLLRLMLENNEMQEFLLSRMNETALEAAALQQEIDEISSLGMETYNVPREFIQAMKN